MKGEETVRVKGAADAEQARDAAFAALQRRDFADAEARFKDLVALRQPDPQDHFGLSMALYEQQRLDESLAQLVAACDREPRFVHAWLYQGVIHERLGRPRAAAGAYLRADRLTNKMPPRSIPPDVQQLLAHGARFLGATLYEELASELQRVSREHGGASVGRMADAVDMFTGRKPLRYEHPRWRPGLFYVPGLPPQTFFERGSFPWAEEVERATDDIRAELRDAMARRSGFEPYVQHAADSPEAQVWKGINNSTDWSTLHLARDGAYRGSAIADCPITARVIRAVPDLHVVPGYGPEIMFSVLKPKTLIPSHRGSVNGRLVVHLPLIVPPNCGYLRVGDDRREWQEGRLMFFDDTFDHEAWNGSDQRRVVLIFDVWNPHLTAPERAAFSAVLVRTAAFERELLGEPPQTGD